MTFFDLVDMTVAYVQYIYILVSISSNSFPDFYLEPFRTLRYLSLEFIDRFSEENRYNNPLEIKLPAWLPLDYRLQFAFIVVIAPLLVSIVGILTVCSTAAFGWIMMTLVAFFSMVLGAVLLANPWVYSELGISHQTRVLLVSIGTVCTLLLISLGVFGVHIWRLRRLREEEAIMVNSTNEGCEQRWGNSLAEKAVMRSEVNRRALAALMAYENGNKHYLRRCHLAVIFPQAVVAAVGFIAGIVFIGLPPISDIRFFQVSRVGRMAGSILIFAALLTFMWVTLGIFRSGRKLQLKMYDLLSSTVLGIMMIAISLIYIPVLMNMINVMRCIEVNCGAGEWMPPPGTLIRSSSGSAIWEKSAYSCFPCDFSMHTQNCPADLQMRLCGRLDVHRLLAYDQSVPCNEVNVFYKATMVVILLSYTVAYPIFLVVVAHRGTTILEKEYPLEKRLLDEFTERELYYEKVRKSANVSAPVYQAYRRTYRKARLTFLLQRVLLVAISCLMSQGIKESLSWLGLMLILLVSMLYFLYTTLLHPYARPVENLYGAAQQFVIVCVASIGLVGNRIGRDNIPFAVSVFFAVIVFVAPLAALIIGLVRTFRKDRERAERLQRRLQNGFAVENKSSRGATTNQNVRNANPSLNVVGDSLAHWMDGDIKVFNGSNTATEKRERQDGMDTLSRNKSPKGRKRSSERIFSKTLSREVREMSNDTSADQKQQKEHEQLLHRNSPYLFLAPGLNDGSLSRRKNSAQGLDSSEAAAERIMRDLIVEVSGQDNNRSEREVPFVQEQNPGVGTNNGVDFPEDDYFNDSRFFLPAAYFRGFEDMSLLSEDLGQDEEGEEEEDHRKQRHVKGMRRWTGEGTIRSLFTLFSTFRGQLSRGSNSVSQKEPLKTEMEEPAATTLRASTKRDRDVTVAEQQQQRQNSTTSDVKNCTYAKTPRNGAFFRWWKRWQKVLNISDFSLKYKDVLERRRSLQKFTGLRDRPFWLLPSETQQQTYNIPGSCVPWYCAKNNRVLATDRNAAGELTTFARLKERKNVKYPPLVVKRKESVSLASIPSIMEAMSFRFGKAETDSPSSTEKEGMRLSSTKRTVAQHSPSENTPIKSSLKRASRRALVSVEDHPTKGTPREEKEISDQSNSLRQTFECTTSAKKQIERLERLCKRSLQNPGAGQRRPTVFAPVFPKVHLEGVEVSDWDEFMQQLLAEVPCPAADSRGALLNFSFPPKSESQSNSMPVKSDRAATKVAHEDDKKKKIKEGKETPELSSLKEIEEVGHTASMGSRLSNNVQLLLRHFVLRRRLCDVFKMQKNRLRALQQAVDFRIAVTIKKYMQWFFLALSVCTTVALVLCLSGMLYGMKEDFVDGVWRDNSVEREMMGYSSWENFTVHCCCLSIVNLTATYPYYLLDVENWLCEDGRVKQRVRRDAYESTIVSGYRVRDLCGMTFRKGCNPTVTSENRVELLGCSEELSEMEKKRW
ncbi:hypothetical protein TCDM_03289 [Trypanosoma cruzi Dm28c]|uniref:Uncharacterized protein n=2 Tax=Trypanosoma cruzi TaxID=5693 RepID=V5DKN5_TRYCR|nr:hypothetical protein TCDM_03289 [Trypanosoma cruzi Dm28c]PBJ77956.1 hypothetical protein BCY84_05362 [Trypanosoma cruzi cruzi]